MTNLAIGCVTRLPDPMPDRYFNLDMGVTGEYPEQDQAEELKNFLQPHIAEIIDEVVYVIDLDRDKMIWEIIE